TPGGEEMGTVSRQWGGMARELFTTANTYGVRTNPEYVGGPSATALVLGAALAINGIFAPGGRSASPSRGLILGVIGGAAVVLALVLVILLGGRGGESKRPDPGKFVLRPGPVDKGELDPKEDGILKEEGIPKEKDIPKAKPLPGGEIALNGELLVGQ